MLFMHLHVLSVLKTQMTHKKHKLEFPNGELGVFAFDNKPMCGHWFIGAELCFPNGLPLA